MLKELHVLATTPFPTKNDVVDVYEILEQHQLEMDEQDERRRTPRYPAIWEVNGRDLRGNKLLGATQNVSLGGAKIVLNRLVYVGERIHIKMHAFHNEGSKIVDAVGHVTYSVLSSDLCYCGVQFIKMPEGTKEFIKTCVNKVY